MDPGVDLETEIRKAEINKESVALLVNILYDMEG